jgi:hypothetical protein
VDPDKIAVILDLEPPISIRQLSETLGHRILQEVYQRLCIYHNTYGKFVEEGSEVPME